MTGMRPVVDIMFGDFIGLIMDQMVEPGGQDPLHVGRQVESAAGGAHDDGRDAEVGRAAFAVAARVVLPHSRIESGDAFDAVRRQGTLKSAIRDDNPVVFFEDKMMYKLKGPVPEDDYTIPLGVADVKRVGDDITLVAHQQHGAGRAGRGDDARRAGVSAEVVDPRTLWPLDEKTLIESAKKTSRVIVVDEGYGRYGVTAELASVIQEDAFFDLEAPVKRMGAMHVPIPFSPPLEDATVPTEQRCLSWRGDVQSARLGLFCPGGLIMALKTHGTMAVDWEQRIDFDRLRNERLARAKALLAKSEMGALLCFDMNNVRYITATHIGTWAQDKISRFTLLPQNDEPILWDFGSAARHHQLNCPWLGDRSRAGISLLRGAMSSGNGPRRRCGAQDQVELEMRGLHNEPLGIDVVEPPDPVRAAARGYQGRRRPAAHVRRARDQDAGRDLAAQHVGHDGRRGLRRAVPRHEARA